MVSEKSDEVPSEREGKIGDPKSRQGGRVNNYEKKLGNPLQINTYYLNEIQYG